MNIFGFDFEFSMINILKTLKCPTQ